MVRLIDMDAVEKITWEDPHYHDPLNVLTEVREKVRALPTVDAEPVRHGRWKKAERMGVWVYSDAYRQCSECNDVIYLGFKMQYCPNCGAKMDAERKEE